MEKVKVSLSLNQNSLSYLNMTTAHWIVWHCGPVQRYIHAITGSDRTHPFTSLWPWCIYFEL